MFVQKNYIYIILTICVILSILYYYYNKNKKVIKTIPYQNLNIKPKIVFYYTEWCGACKSFKPTWEKIEQTDGNFTTLKIDCDKYKQIAEDNNITEFPTIHKHIDDIKVKYEGNFTYDDVMKFISS